MQLRAGSRLGAYEIVAPVGAGGMGEVYRARDPRIGRDVAIKILPKTFADQPDRLHRFEQEARTAGTLNHPNLVTVFDLGTENGLSYIVMEMLEGETLRHALGDPVPAKLPVRKAVDYGAQIASGLAAAHEKGIVHRDLKPDNVFITNDGRVKILDFGLAKLHGKDHSVNLTDERTAHRDTTPGTVLGTVGYMSPEQIRAQNVDHRSDIFSFGAILYEMLSGQRAFRGASAADTMSAILREDPPELTDSNPNVSPGIDRVVRHCLEKNPEQRFQSARDLAFDLANLSASSASSIARPAEPAARLPLRALTFLLLALAAVAIAYFLGARSRGTASSPIAGRSFRQLTYSAGDELLGTLSPDGKTFAFVSKEGENVDIFVQRTDGRNATNLTKDFSGLDTDPSFSPDGSTIAFRSERDGGGIFIMGATGESVRRLTDFGANPCWSPDGSRIAFSTEAIRINPRSRNRKSDLWIVDVRSGATKRILEGADAVQPSWSPNGHRIVYWGIFEESGQRDLWTIAPDAPDPKKSVVRLTSDPAVDWNPVWSPDGKYVYFGSNRDSTDNVWRIAVDEENGRAAGNPEPVAFPAQRTGNYSISRNGEIIFAAYSPSTRIERHDLSIATGTISPDGKEILSGSQSVIGPLLSRDGKMITWSNRGEPEDIFVARADGSDIRQLTNDDEIDRGPSFTWDGKKIFFYAQRNGPRYETWSMNVDGSGLTQITHSTGAALWFPRPSPDGTKLILHNETGLTLYDIARKSYERIPNPRDEVLFLASWSPDGTKLVALGGDFTTNNQKGLHVIDLTTRKSQKISEQRGFHIWLDDATIALLSPEKMFLLSPTGKVLREIAYPKAIANVDEGVLSPDGKSIFAITRSLETDIWLMRPAAAK